MNPTLTAEDLMPRVLNGATWLDAERPGWAGRIDIADLAMHDCRVCMLGQLFGGYFATITRMDPEYALDREMFDVSPWAIAHGFVLHNDEADKDTFAEGGPEWELLRNCWIAAIKERL